jgi:hypothetical protein
MSVVLRMLVSLYIRIQSLIAGDLDVAGKSRQRRSYVEGGGRDDYGCHHHG